MKFEISNELLSFYIDKRAEIIEKVVSSKASTPTKAGKGAQGTIYVNKNYIGRSCVFILLEPKFDGDEAQYFSHDGELFEYYGLIVRDVKSVKTVKEYTTGRVYLPYEWIGKRVKGIILAD